MKDTDADMFIQNFQRKLEIDLSFYFAYELDVDGRLKHAFWVDGIARNNYTMYAEIVSFDTTYDTNRNKMILVPLIGLDNHRLCVTFGAAFLGDEKKQSLLYDYFKSSSMPWGVICLFVLLLIKILL